MEHSEVRQPYGYIYLIRNRINGKVYVGQTIDPVQRRFTEHKCDAKAGRGSYLHNAIRKHGPDAFDVVMLHQAFSAEELNEMERRAIRAHESMCSEYGYNLTEGGEPGTRGYRHTEETKKRISAAHKGNKVWLGRTHSEETRRKLRDIRKRQTFSDEACQRMSEAQRRYFSAPEARKKTSEATKRYYLENPDAIARMSESRKGRIHSEETRRKMSEAQRLRWTKRKTA